MRLGNVALDFEDAALLVVLGDAGSLDTADRRRDCHVDHRSRRLWWGYGRRFGDHCNGAADQRRNIVGRVGLSGRARRARNALLSLRAYVPYLAPFPLLSAFPSASLWPRFAGRSALAILHRRHALMHA